MTEVLQVAQHAEDLDRAAAFYTRLLGAPPAARFDPPGLVFFRPHPARCSTCGSTTSRPPSRRSGPTVSSCWPSPT